MANVQLGLSQIACSVLDSSFCYGPVIKHRERRYWPLTSAAARMIMNRLPRASNLGRCTPYELYFGRKPDFSSLRVFGCLCYYWLPPILRTGYQQPFLEFSTASEGIFAGYDEHMRSGCFQRERTHMFWQEVSCLTNFLLYIFKEC